MLDDLDMKILRELSGSTSKRWDARPSYRAVARKVGVDEETLRLRVIRIRKSGIMASWRILLNPNLLGCQEARVEAMVGDRVDKESVLSSLRSLPGVHTIIDFREPEIAVVLYYADDQALARARRAIEGACRTSSSTVWEMAAPAVKLKMHALDWRILAALHEDAWRDLADIATELGTSTRTVQRRLAALKESKAAYLARMPDLRTLPGLVCHFLVTFSDAEQKRRADALIRESLPKIIAYETTFGPTSLFSIVCTNYHEADDILALLRSMPGAGPVRMRLPKRFIQVTDWVREAVDQRARASKPVRNRDP